MSTRARSSRIVALAAAYVVALQALLLPLSVAAGAPMASGLCATSSESRQAPIQNDAGCPCAAGCGMQCCSQAMDSSPQRVTDFSADAIQIVAAVPAFERIARPIVKGPHAARGPPVS